MWNICCMFVFMKGFLKFMISTPANLLELGAILGLGVLSSVVAYRQGAEPILVLYGAAMVLMVVNKVLLYRRNK